MEHFFYDKYRLGLWELQHDVIFGKIPAERYSELIDLAWDAGRTTADEYREKYQTSVPEKLAEKMGVAIVDLADGATLPDYQVFSEYFSNLKKIVLYKNTIFAATVRLAAEGIIPCADYLAVRKLFIAHEIFHHIECHYHGLTSQRCKVTTFRLGPLKITSGVRALCEIGAHSFTKTLLNMNGEEKHV